MTIGETERLALQELTVNGTIRRFPASVAVFNRFGIDACCGGAAPVRDAALRDGADPDALVEALAAAVLEPA